TGRSSSAKAPRLPRRFKPSAPRGDDRPFRLTKSLHLRRASAYNPTLTGGKPSGRAAGGRLFSPRWRGEPNEGVLLMSNTMMMDRTGMGMPGMGVPGMGTSPMGSATGMPMAPNYLMVPRCTMTVE